MKQRGLIACFLGLGLATCMDSPPPSTPTAPAAASEEPVRGGGGGSGLTAQSVGPIVMTGACPSTVKFGEGDIVRGSCQPGSPVVSQTEGTLLLSRPDTGWANHGIRYTYDSGTNTLSWSGSTFDDNHIPRSPFRRETIHNVTFEERDDDRLFLHVQRSTVNRPTGRTVARFSLSGGTLMIIAPEPGPGETRLLANRDTLRLESGTSLSFQAGPPPVYTYGPTSRVSDLITHAAANGLLANWDGDGDPASTSLQQGNTTIGREMVPVPAFRIGPAWSQSVEGNWTIEIGARGEWNAQIPSAMLNSNKWRRYRFDAPRISFYGTGCSPANYVSVNNYPDGEGGSRINGIVHGNKILPIGCE